VFYWSKGNWTPHNFSPGTSPIGRRSVGDESYLKFCTGFCQFSASFYQFSDSLGSSFVGNRTPTQILQKPAKSYKIRQKPVQNLHKTFKSRPNAHTSPMRHSLLVFAGFCRFSVAARRDAPQPECCAKLLKI
jgi:hypothetical protein